MTQHHLDPRPLHDRQPLADIFGPSTDAHCVCSRQDAGSVSGTFISET